MRAGALAHDERAQSCCTWLSLASRKDEGEGIMHNSSVGRRTSPHLCHCCKTLLCCLFLYGLISLIFLSFIANLIHIINLPILNILIGQLFKLSPALGHGDSDISHMTSLMLSLGRDNALLKQLAMVSHFSRHWQAGASRTALCLIQYKRLSEEQFAEPITAFV